MNFAITVISLGTVFLILTWLAIFHIMARDFGSPVRKTVWGLVVVGLPFLGVLLYIIWGRRQGVRPSLEEITELEDGVQK
ncbi:PLD nuclease N-terminal domain-containing protein [Desulfatibacillum aliphaticivorans]|uniref:Cardiolipin synthase N-terminal domain-containing protein n=1 Tax=Desulfatibacillum aliphaticivorans TaxID=218208 RepID=B8FL08_DESAL|nr:PLD nuclease N-terminal domain-containing protein [Desulfatibacillum aliphaticivorans]ACL04643.1 hypothetical protein Dalk_2953 [Desulfatibacillum aliphaticivorans]